MKLKGYKLKVDDNDPTVIHADVPSNPYSYRAIECKGYKFMQAAPMAEEVAKRWNEHEELIELLVRVKSAAHMPQRPFGTAYFIPDEVMERVDKATDGIVLLDILRAKKSEQQAT